MAKAQMKNIDYRRLRPVWVVRQEYKLSASATLLQFALMEFQLLAGNNAFFSVSTSEIQLLTGLSESAVKVARKQLIEHGIIEYKSGHNKNYVSQYRLLGVKINPQCDPQKTIKSASPTLYIKNYSFKERINKISHSKEELKSVEELSVLASDVDWIHLIMSWLENSTGYKIREEEVVNKYAEFMSYLMASGQVSKTISDTKAHFVNWLKKNYSKCKYKTEDTDYTILRNNKISKFRSGEGW